MMCFRPQQGLLIMNSLLFYAYRRRGRKQSFRPQQGLLIMNGLDKDTINTFTMIGFPSPTGVTYYESSNKKLINTLGLDVFPSPTGVTYYEFNLMKKLELKLICYGFRPQQGLLIMNRKNLR